MFAKVINHYIQKEQLILYMCDKPNESALPALPHKNYKRKFFKIPVQSVGIDKESEVVVSMLERLERANSIKSVHKLETIVSPCLRSRNDTLTVEAGEHKNVDCSDANSCFDKAFGSVDLVFSPMNSPHKDRQNVSSLPYLAETSIFGQLEWARFLSVFFNAEFDTRNIVTDSIRRYGCHALHSFDTSPRRPILWTSRHISGKYLTKPTDRALQHFIYSSGGHLIEREFDSLDELKLSTEAKNAYAWISEDDMLTTFSISDFQSFTSVKNENVYDVFKLAGKNSTDFTQTRVVYPEIWLQELRSVIHPEKYGSWNRIWLRNHTKKEKKGGFGVNDCGLFTTVHRNRFCPKVEDRGKAAVFEFRLPAIESSISLEMTNNIRKSFANGFAHEIGHELESANMAYMEATCDVVQISLSVKAQLHIPEGFAQPFETVPRQLGWLQGVRLLDRLEHIIGSSIFKKSFLSEWESNHRQDGGDTNDTLHKAIKKSLTHLRQEAKLGRALRPTLLEPSSHSPLDATVCHFLKANKTDESISDVGQSPQGRFLMQSQAFKLSGHSRLGAADDPSGFLQTFSGFTVLTLGIYLWII
eukprot:Filipodium_phascolosomae@DN2022_c0_g1_i1.p1